VPVKFGRRFRSQSEKSKHAIRAENKVLFRTNLNSRTRRVKNVNRFAGIRNEMNCSADSVGCVGRRSEQQTGGKLFARLSVGTKDAKENGQYLSAQFAVMR